MHLKKFIFNSFEGNTLLNHAKGQYKELLLNSEIQEVGYFSSPFSSIKDGLVDVEFEGRSIYDALGRANNDPLSLDVDYVQINEIPIEQGDYYLNGNATQASTIQLFSSNHQYGALQIPQGRFSLPISLKACDVLYCESQEETTIEDLCLTLNPTQEYPSEPKHSHINSVYVSQRNMINKEILLRGIPSDLYTIDIIDGRECLNIPSSNVSLLCTTRGKILQGAFKPNTRYTLKYVGRVVKGTQLLFRIVYIDGTVEYSDYTTGDGFLDYTKLTQSNKSIDYIEFFYNETSNISYIDLNSIMLYEGSSLEVYEPLEEKQELNITLRQNTQYKDTIEKFEDKFYHVQRVSENGDTLNSFIYTKLDYHEITTRELQTLITTDADNVRPNIKIRNTGYPVKLVSNNSYNIKCTSNEDVRCKINGEVITKNENNEFIYTTPNIINDNYIRFIGNGNVINPIVTLGEGHINLNTYYNGVKSVGRECKNICDHIEVVTGSLDRFSGDILVGGTYNNYITTSGYIKVNVDETYKASCQYGNTIIEASIFVFNEAKELIAYAMEGSCTIPENGKFVRISANLSGYTSDKANFKFMLNVGIDNLPYEDFYIRPKFKLDGVVDGIAVDTIQFELDAPLIGLYGNDVLRDKIMVKNDHLVVERVFKKLVINDTSYSSMVISQKDENPEIVRIAINQENDYTNLFNDIACVSDFLPASATSSNECFSILNTTSQIILLLHASRFESIDEQGVKSWLKNHPITIYYASKEKEYITLEYGLPNGEVYMLNSDNIQLRYEDDIIPRVNISILTNFDRLQYNIPKRLLSCKNIKDRMYWDEAKGYYCIEKKLNSFSITKDNVYSDYTQDDFLTVSYVRNAIMDGKDVIYDNINFLCYDKNVQLNLFPDFTKASIFVGWDNSYVVVRTNLTLEEYLNYIAKNPIRVVYELESYETIDLTQYNTRGGLIVPPIEEVERYD